MSKKLMLPFLTEWLIKDGTEPVAIDGVINMPIFYTATRKGFIQQVAVGKNIYRLTKDGVKYLQENQK